MNDWDELVEDDDSEVNNAPDRAADPVATPPQKQGVSESSGVSSTDDPSSPEVDLENSGAAFPFDTQETVYVTSESWRNYDDFKHATSTYLRNEFNVRNVQGRELDEVFLRMAVDKLTPEEIGEMIVRLRGYDPEKHR